jgi:hypothetical protein
MATGTMSRSSTETAGFPITASVGCNHKGGPGVIGSGGVSDVSLFQPSRAENVSGFALAELRGAAAGHFGPGPQHLRAPAVPGLVPARALPLAARPRLPHEGPRLAGPRPSHHRYHRQHPHGAANTFFHWNVCNYHSSKNTNALLVWFGVDSCLLWTATAPFLLSVHPMVSERPNGFGKSSILCM